MVKIGISSVSSGNALLNLDNEIPDWDFNKVVNETRAKWNNEMQKMTIEGTQEEKETFILHFITACLPRRFMKMLMADIAA